MHAKGFSFPFLMSRIFFLFVFQFSTAERDFKLRIYKYIRDLKSRTYHRWNITYLTKYTQRKNLAVPPRLSLDANFATRFTFFPFVTKAVRNRLSASATRTSWLSYACAHRRISATIVWERSNKQQLHPHDLSVPNSDGHPLTATLLAHRHNAVANSTCSTNARLLSEKVERTRLTHQMTTEEGDYYRPELDQRCRLIEAKI